MATPTFIYDDACPMCKGYTGVFTGLRWSERRAFSELKPGAVPGLDLDRGRHEIPLFDAATGEIRYGLDAMTTVIGNALPHLKPLIRQPWFISALKPVYWLITYNRRVIAGTKPPATGFDCAPDYHIGWRLAYLGLLAGLVVMIGLPPWPLLAGFGLAAVAGLLLNQEGLTFLGHLFTILLLATTVLAVLPGGVGMVAAYGIAASEGWRRL